MKVFRVSHKLRRDLWTPVKGLGQSRMMELTRKYLISSGKTLNFLTWWWSSQFLHAVFVSLLRFFSRLVPNKPVAFGLKANEQFLLALVKLKQAVQNQDLADRFCIHITEVLKVFHLWKDVMFNVVTDLIPLLDHGLIRKNLPKCFKGNYSTLLASSTVQKCSLND